MDLGNGLQFLYKMMPSPANRYHGLLNQGATCYLNSVLQVLFMTEDFLEAVERLTCGNECIDPQLKSLFNDLKQHAAYTYNITQKLGINNVNEQRDAAEYYEKILGLTSPDASKIFHGLLTHKTICSACRTETDTDGAFWNLSLALVDYRKHYSVVKGIEEYFRASDFSGENQMYCDECDAKSDATIKCVIKHHPEVLMLLLKRFEFDYRYMTYVKINRTVDVPHTLQIPENQAYELYAVVDHFGDLRSGHYTATIKSQEDDKWYNFNDATVTLPDYQPFQLDDLEKSSSAYLLFYRKNKVHPADTCSQDIREVPTPGGFLPSTSDIYDHGQDAAEREEYEKAAEAGNNTEVAVSIDRNEETGIEAKDQAVKRETPLEESVTNKENDSGEIDDVRHRRPHECLEGDDIPSTSCNQQEVSNMHESCDNPHQVSVDIQRDEERGGQMEGEPSERREIDSTKHIDKDAEHQVDEGLDDVRQNMYEDQEGTQEAGQDYNLKPVSLDKQGDNGKMEIDVRLDKERQTGADETGMASGSARLLTKYDLCYDEIQGNRRVGDSKQNMAHNDPMSRREISSRFYHKQPKEEKRDVKGKEQKRRDHKHAERKGTSERLQHSGQDVEDQNNDVRQNRSECVTRTTQNDVGAAKHQEKKGDNGEDSSLRQPGLVASSRQGDAQPKARTGYNEGAIKRCGSKQSKTYDGMIIEEEFKDGVRTSCEIKNMRIETLAGTSQDGVKSLVEYNDGNVKRKSDTKTDATVTLSEGVHNLKLNDSPEQKQPTRRNKRRSDAEDQDGIKQATKKRKLQISRKQKKKHTKTTGCLSFFRKRRKIGDQNSESD